MSTFTFMWRMTFFIVILQIITCKWSFAQDIHWSQINHLQSYQNPSLIGDYLEQLKLTFALKDQWRNVTKPYQTYLASVDSKLRRIESISLGFQALTDVTGDGSFQTNSVNLITKHTLKINKKTTISNGIDVGLINKNIDYTNFYFDNQYDGYKYNSNINSNENYILSSFSHPTIGFGSSSKVEFDTRNSLTIGIALFNLNKPKESFNNLVIERPIRSHFNIRYTLNFKKSKLSFTLNHTKQKKYNETLLNTEIYFNSKNQKKTSVYTGISHRINDAMIVNFGIISKKININASYDINISKLKKASNGRGSLEITIQYLIQKRKINYPIQQKCIDYY